MDESRSELDEYYQDGKSPELNGSRQEENAPEPEGACEKTPEPEEVREKDPEPEGAREKAPEPEEAREKAPEPEGAREKTPEPEEVREKAPEPEEAREKAPGLDEYYQEEKRSEPEKKKSRKPLIITLCVVAAAAVVFAVLAFTGVLFPKNELKVMTAFQKTTQTLAARSELSQFTYDMIKEGRIGTEIKAEKIGSSIADSLSGVLPEYADYLSYLSLVDIRAGLSAVSDRSGNASAFVSGSIFGNEAKAGYTSNSEGNGDAILSFPLLFEKPLGVSLDHVEEDLDQSIFAPDSNSSYAMNETIYGIVKKLFLMMKEAGKAAEKSDLSALDLQLYSDVYTCLKLQKKTEEVDAGDGTIRCAAYSSEIDEEKAIAICDAVGAWYGRVEKRDITKAEDISTIADLADYLGAQLKGSGFHAVTRFYVYNDYLVKSSVEAEMNGGKVFVVSEAGSDPSVSDTASVRFGYNDTELEAKFDLSRASSGAFDITVSSDSLGFSEKVSFSYDKDASSFTAGGTYISVDGTMKLDKDSLTISDPTIRLLDMTELTLNGFSVRIGKEESVPSIAQEFPDGYTNVLKMSEEEMNELIGNIGKIFDLFSFLS